MLALALVVAFQNAAGRRRADALPLMHGSGHRGRRQICLPSTRGGGGGGGHGDGGHGDGGAAVPLGADAAERRSTPKVVASICLAVVGHLVYTSLATGVRCTAPAPPRRAQLDEALPRHGILRGFLRWRASASSAVRLAPHVESMLQAPCSGRLPPTRRLTSPKKPDSAADAAEVAGS